MNIVYEKEYLNIWKCEKKKKIFVKRISDAKLLDKKFERDTKFINLFQNVAFPYKLFITSKMPNSSADDTHKRLTMIIDLLSHRIMP